MAIKYLFFDFDGTISDARAIAMKNLISLLRKNNISFNSLQAKKLLGLKMEQIFLKLGVKEKKKIKSLIKTFFRKMILDIKKIKLCVSVKPLWKMKKEKKYRFIVISNSESSFIFASAKKLGVHRLFDRFYCAEKFSSKDKLLKKLFKKYQISPKEAVYIGDRFSDIVFARKAGCFAISIHNKCSWSSLKDVKKHKPDFIIRDFASLERIIKNI
jgi:FMN phosphatase YigB (HAD superfamily)